jgi:hypothetical protein
MKTMSQVIYPGAAPVYGSAPVVAPMGAAPAAAPVVVVGNTGGRRYSRYRKFRRKVRRRVRRYNKSSQGLFGIGLGPILICVVGFLFVTGRLDFMKKSA